MTAYLIARTAKSLALLALTGGVALSVAAADASLRRRAVDRLAFPGLLGVWCSGYVLAKLTERGLGAPAITVAMVASLVLMVVLDRSPTGRAPRALGIGALVAATVAMHLRDVPGLLLPAALLTLAATTAVAAFTLPSLDPVEPDPDAAIGRLRAFALFETMTTAALFLVDMPARHGFGVRLDGGLGLFGWVHGAAVIGYLTVVLANHRTLGNSLRQTSLRTAAGVVPFASLWVLHGTARNTSGTASSV